MSHFCHRLILEMSSSFLLLSVCCRRGSPVLMSNEMPVVGLNEWGRLCLTTNQVTYLEKKGSCLFFSLDFWARLHLGKSCPLCTISFRSRLESSVSWGIFSLLYTKTRTRVECGHQRLGNQSKLVEAKLRRLVCTHRKFFRTGTIPSSPSSFELLYHTPLLLGLGSRFKPQACKGKAAAAV